MSVDMFPDSAIEYLLEHGEPTYANRADIDKAAEVFVAALGTANRAILIENLRNVEGRSDALNSLNAALSKVDISGRIHESTG